MASILLISLWRRIFLRSARKSFSFGRSKSQLVGLFAAPREISVVCRAHLILAESFSAFEEESQVALCFKSLKMKVYPIPQQVRGSCKFSSLMLKHIIHQKAG